MMNPRKTITWMTNLMKTRRKTTWWKARMDKMTHPKEKRRRETKSTKIRKTKTIRNTKRKIRRKTKRSTRNQRTRMAIKM